MNMQELKKIAEEAIKPRMNEERRWRSYEEFENAFGPEVALQLISNYEKAVEALKFYGDKSNWFSELPDYLSSHNCINEDDLEREKPFFYKIGGVKARQTLKELGEVE